LALDTFELANRDSGKVDAFGEILADKTVRIFIRAPLPWLTRMRKVHLDSGVNGELFVPAHFCSLVVGQRLWQTHQVADVILEMHDTEDRRAEFEQFVREIGAIMPLIHIHGNSCRAYGTDGLPTFVEVTFARHDLVGDSRVLEFPRSGLDYPNDPELPELELKFEVPAAG